jgi:Cellulase N-terminal ig-like domain
VASHYFERFPIDRRKLLKTSVAITTANLASVLPDARGNSGGQSGIVGKLGSGGNKSSTNTTWSQGLTLGVNGPIPVIVVDQFGYPTRASKIALIRDPQVGYDNAAHFTPGTTYAVVDQSTGKITKQGPPTAWNDGATDDVSGDKVWWFDFSDVTTPGTYTIMDIDKSLRSPEFQIDDGVYRNVLKHAVRMYFYQRAGFKKNRRDSRIRLGRRCEPYGRRAGSSNSPVARPARFDRWVAKRVHQE